MVSEFNSKIAYASWCQRERWHHVQHVTHIAIFPVRV